MGQVSTEPHRDPGAERLLLRPGEMSRTLKEPKLNRHGEVTLLGADLMAGEVQVPSPTR